MDFIKNLLLVILVGVCLLMVLVILMQRPKQEGLGAAFGGAMTDQMWGSQTTNVLQKFTVWLAILFFVITLVLSMLLASAQKRASTLGEIKGDGKTSISAPPGEEGTGVVADPGAGPIQVQPAGTPIPNTDPISLTPGQDNNLTTPLPEPEAPTPEPVAPAPVPVAPTPEPVIPTPEPISPDPDPVEEDEAPE